MKMSAYKISDNFNGVAGSKVMSPHHSHPTNGVRPSDSNRKMIKAHGVPRFVLLGAGYIVSLALTFSLVPP